MYNEVKDSGQRQTFSTGSVRDVKEGKGAFDLLPLFTLRRLAQHYQNGAKKYGRNNYLLGQPLMGYVDSAMRHLFRWVMGWKDEDHLAAAIWNLCAILETEELIRRGKLPKELDDRLEIYMDDELWETGKSPEKIEEIKLTVEQVKNESNIACQKHPDDWIKSCEQCQNEYLHYYGTHIYEDL